MWININNGVKGWEVTAFVRACWTNTETMKGSNKWKLFVKAVGMNGSNFKKWDAFRVFYGYIITTRNGWDGTNFYIGNRMVSSIRMLRNRLVNIIVPYGTKVFSKYVRLTSACFTDVKFTTFTGRNAVNDVGGGARKIVRMTKLDLGPEIDVAKLRNEDV